MNKWKVALLVVELNPIQHSTLYSEFTQQPHKRGRLKPPVRHQRGYGKDTSGIREFSIAVNVPLVN